MGRTVGTVALATIHSYSRQYVRTRAGVPNTRDPTRGRSQITPVVVPSSDIKSPPSDSTLNSATVKSLGMRFGRNQSESRRKRDRAVSETISFVLVFSLVIASVGTVYAVGVSELEETRDAERIENAQRAFDVLADNVRDVIEGAPSRGTEVKLADATVRSADDAAMNVTVDPADGPPQFWEFSSSPLVYEAASGGEIRLSNGAVLRDSDRGGPQVPLPGQRAPVGRGTPATRSVPRRPAGPL